MIPREDGINEKAQGVTMARAPNENIWKAYPGLDTILSTTLLVWPPDLTLP